MWVQSFCTCTRDYTVWFSFIVDVKRNTLPHSGVMSQINRPITCDQVFDTKSNHCPPRRVRFAVPVYVCMWDINKATDRCRYHVCTLYVLSGWGRVNTAGSMDASRQPIRALSTPLVCGHAPRIYTGYACDDTVISPRDCSSS